MAEMNKILMAGISTVESLARDFCGEMWTQDVGPPGLLGDLNLTLMETMIRAEWLLNIAA